FGGYAEYVSTQAEGVAAIPAGWDPGRATSLTTQACTAVYCAEEVINLYPGERVLIQAASGGVGRTLIQLAKHYGCEVFATASGGKQDYLKEMGVDHPIDYIKEDFSQRIPEILNGEKLDVVFDNLGGKRYKQGLNLLGPAGRIVSYGAADNNKGSKSGKWNTIKLGLGFGFHSPIKLVMKSQAMIGVNMLRIADYKPLVLKKTLNRVIELVDKGIIDPRLDKTFSADKIAEAHDYLESRKSKGKVVIIW
ncbi:MAG: zinc-binding dehydrogenase, partial [Bacteroidetes bacterium]|nr:zinc-binding dehydrogenase [Bacteroidota bacterium]